MHGATRSHGPAAARSDRKGDMCPASPRLPGWHTLAGTKIIIQAPVWAPGSAPAGSEPGAGGKAPCSLQGEVEVCRGASWAPACSPPLSFPLPVLLLPSLQGCSTQDLGWAQLPVAATIRSRSARVSVKKAGLASAEGDQGPGDEGGQEPRGGARSARERARGLKDRSCVTSFLCTSRLCTRGQTRCLHSIVPRQPW